MAEFPNLEFESRLLPVEGTNAQHGFVFFELDHYWVLESTWLYL
jgi:hypothetical protein